MEAGQEPSLFWRLTLREISVILDGAASRLKREHNDRAWLAWHVAALGRLKKLPKLKDMMHGEKPRGRKMTPEQLEAATRSWLAGARNRRK